MKKKKVDLAGLLHDFSKKHEGDAEAGLELMQFLQGNCQHIFRQQGVCELCEDVDQFEIDRIALLNKVVQAEEEYLRASGWIFIQKKKFLKEGWAPNSEYLERHPLADGFPLGAAMELQRAKDGK